jgi:two-component sensor histidine kinase
MNYIIASRRYLIDYDLGEQKLEGRSHYEIFPEIPERWKGIHRRCLAGAVESAEADPFPRANGKLDWVRWEILPWYEDLGGIGGIILFSEVITERKLAEEKLKAALEEKEILLREVHHRVKNNLQAIIALLQMRGSQVGDDDVRQFLKELEGQARTMSLIYEQLYQSEYLSRIDMGPYIQKLTDYLLDSYSGSRYLTLKLDIDPIYMDVARAMPCGLIINELVTNALKHAFPPGFDGTMTLWVTLHQKENTYHLSVRDNGVGLLSNLDWQTTETLGIRLVNLWATHQLGGTLNVTNPLTSSGEPGMLIDICFAL